MKFEKNIFVSYTKGSLQKQRDLALAIAEEKEIEKDILNVSSKLEDYAIAFPEENFQSVAAEIYATSYEPGLYVGSLCHEVGHLTEIGWLASRCSEDIYNYNPAAELFLLFRRRKNLRRKIRALRAVAHVCLYNHIGSTSKFLKIQSKRINDKSGEEINSLLSAAA